MKKLFYKIFIASIVMFPAIIFAATPKPGGGGKSSPKDLQSVIGLFIQVIQSRIIPILIGLAVLAFIWGLFQYLISDSEEKRAESRQVILYGVISIFVMVAVWGLVALVGSIIGIDTGSPQRLQNNTVDYKSLPVK